MYCTTPDHAKPSQTTPNLKPELITIAYISLFEHAWCSPHPLEIWPQASGPESGTKPRNCQEQGCQQAVLSWGRRFLRILTITYWISGYILYYYIIQFYILLLHLLLMYLVKNISTSTIMPFATNTTYIPTTTLHVRIRPAYQLHWERSANALEDFWLKGRGVQTK